MIPFERVQHLWDSISTYSPEAFQELIRQFKRAQPDVGGYLIALEEQGFDEQEIEFLLYAGIMMWKILQESERPPTRVTPEDLERSKEKLYDSFIDLATESPVDRHFAIRRSFDTHPESDLMRAMLSALYQVSEKAEEYPMRMRPSSTEVAGIHLTIVLNALIESREEEEAGA